MGGFGKPGPTSPDPEFGSWVGFAAWANLENPDPELGSWVGFAAWANLENPRCVL
jgi:hypothetical protein